MSRVSPVMISNGIRPLADPASVDVRRIMSHVHRKP